MLVAVVGFGSEAVRLRPTATNWLRGWSGYGWRFRGWRIQYRLYR